MAVFKYEDYASIIEVLKEEPCYVRELARKLARRYDFWAGRSLSVLERRLRYLSDLGTVVSISVAEAQIENDEDPSECLHPILSEEIKAASYVAATLNKYERIHFLGEGAPLYIREGETTYREVFAEDIVGEPPILESYPEVGGMKYVDAKIYYLPERMVDPDYIRIFRRKIRWIYRASAAGLRNALTIQRALAIAARRVFGSRNVEANLILDSPKPDCLVHNPKLCLEITSRCENAVDTRYIRVKYENTPPDYRLVILAHVPFTAPSLDFCESKGIIPLNYLPEDNSEGILMTKTLYNAYGEVFEALGRRIKAVVGFYELVDIIEDALVLLRRLRI